MFTLLSIDPDDDEAEKNERMGLEARTAESLRESFAGQRQFVLDTFDADLAVDLMGRDTEEVLRAIRSGSDWQNRIQAALLEGADLGVQVAVKQLENVGFAFDWTMAHGDAREYVNGYTFGLINGINNTTERLLRQSLTAWINNGGPLSDLETQLAPIFGANRAVLIASTEITHVYAQGTLASYRHSGVVKKMEWRTARDEMVCSICGGLHGTRAPLDGMFNGYFPAAHPRCRCWIAGVV